ncbi:hypothetical protein FRC07_010117 [Ceratobasidium sp. 392]|nr:hypothetical protein FRC07_010117 [Ceratobasidium sp. 392]
MRSDEFEPLASQHRTFHLDLTNEDREHRRFRRRPQDNHNAQPDLVSLQSRVLALHNAITTYDADVCATSRNVSNRNTFADLSSEMDGQAEPQSPVNVQTSTSSAATLISSSRSGSEVLDPASDSSAAPIIPSAPEVQSTGQVSQPGAVLQNQSFEAIISHVPENSNSTGAQVSNEPSRSGTTWYRRIFSFATPNREIHIVDHQLHQLRDDEVDINDDALRAVSNLGQRWMGRLDVNGSRVFDHGREYLSMEDAIENFEDFGIQDYSISQ